MAQVWMDPIDKDFYVVLDIGLRGFKVSRDEGVWEIASGLEPRLLGRHPDGSRKRVELHSFSAEYYDTEARCQRQPDIPGSAAEVAQQLYRELLSTG